tara:strand:- start:831 stop:977 length:147 start_codon:yes stop_codon:yes gene_type:complete
MKKINIESRRNEKKRKFISLELKNELSLNASGSKIAFIAIKNKHIIII